MVVSPCPSTPTVKQRRSQRRQLNWRQSTVRRAQTAPDARKQQFPFPSGRLAPLHMDHPLYSVLDPPERPLIDDFRLSPSQRSRSCYRVSVLSPTCNSIGFTLKTERGPSPCSKFASYQIPSTILRGQQVFSINRYCFVVEWLDNQSGIIWKYQLLYFPDTQEIEMHDIKNRRVFLKRTKFPEMKRTMFFVGARINICSRHLKICSYSDESTRLALESANERTCALVKPDGLKNLGKIMDTIFHNDLSIAKLQMCQLTKEKAEEFYETHRTKQFFPKLTSFMSSDSVVAMELVGYQAIQKWRDLMGPTDTAVAQSKAPASLRACFGTDGTANACHGSDSLESSAKESAFFFSGRHNFTSPSRKSSTLGLIKPHVFVDGKAGLIVDRIQSEFTIKGMQLFILDSTSAAEFYEVYKGVVNPGEFNAMVDELVSGPFLALEVLKPDVENSVGDFREMCGPSDPQLAKALRPESLRARFGQNKVQNAVHCTDLPEDGVLEVDYFFSVLQGVCS